MLHERLDDNVQILGRVCEECVLACNEISILVTSARGATSRVEWVGGPYSEPRNPDPQTRGYHS
jgi:hypothetical protein